MSRQIDALENKQAQANTYGNIILRFARGLEIQILI